MSKQPLVGATIKVADVQPLMGASADVGGNFRIENVPIGRHRIEVSFVGYETYISDNNIPRIRPDDEQMGRLGARQSRTYIELSNRFSIKKSFQTL